MRVLAIDASSKSGWAILQDGKLEEYGLVETPCNDNSWPFGIHKWAEQVAERLDELVVSKPFVDKILIERANSSRFRSSQNFIDWFHCKIIDISKDRWQNKIEYIDTATWRKKINLVLSKEQKKQNQLISKNKKAGNKVVKINGKRIGRITKKHLSVLFANNYFGLKLKLKDNDIADALNIGYSFFI